VTDQELLSKFIAKSPFAVLTGLATQAVVESDLDQVFEEHREKQYTRRAKFSAVAMAVADVALGFSENFNQAYTASRKNLGICLQSFYDKINHTEPGVSEKVVEVSARRATGLQDALGLKRRKILPSYRVFGIDGNVLAKTDKRLGVLRDAKGAPLPGKVVARFDLQRQLFDRAYLLTDGHAQESDTCDRVAADLVPGDVIVADRHYCILRFFERIAAAGGHFVIRQHGRLKGVLLGKRKRLGRTDTGVVYEQEMRLSQQEDAPVVRRITLVLDKPTRDEASEIHVLTNLPAEVDGREIVQVYRLRWEEERAFHVLQMTLTCELASVAHPQAALFLFCLAMLAYNIRQVVFAALFATHPAEQVAEVSHFKIAEEVRRYTDGMLVVIDEAMWERLLPSTERGVVAMMRSIAEKIDLSAYKKSHRGPKKKKPHRSRNVASRHVSTARLLGIT
jgi:hypothetical protein